MLLLLVHFLLQGLVVQPCLVPVFLLLETFDIVLEHFDLFLKILRYVFGYVVALLFLSEFRDLCSDVRYLAS